ncbi:hypothetical protein OROGR_014150 [Orobanche gracilis]
MRKGISKKYIDIIKDMYGELARVCELMLGRLKSSQFKMECIKYMYSEMMIINAAMFC